LRYKVLAYEIGTGSNSASKDIKGKSKASSGLRLDKLGEWETAENEMGELNENESVPAYNQVLWQ
jgi:hypothetical protein